MIVSQLSKMINGWFVGNFSPSVFKTESLEAALKKYSAGQYENKHFHKIATEITLIVSGHIKMNGVDYFEGDIIIIEPYDTTDFISVTDSITMVLKIPGVLNDKYTE